MRISNKLPVLALLLVAPSLMGQETMGTILGTIKDSNGQPLSAALVHITAPKLLGERILTTDANGNFRQPNLAPGDYTLTVSKAGYIGSRATFHLNAGDNKRQDLQIKVIPKQGEAVVEVLATSAQVDKTETITKSSFSAEDVENITGFGVSGGSMAYNAMSLAPGVVAQGAAGSSGMQYAAIRGGSQMDTQYVVNGVSSRDNVTAQGRLGDYVLDDTIEDTAVIQSPLNAKYGNTAGGMVSVVTKRGGNDWSGSVRAKLNDSAWNALQISPLSRNNTPLVANGLPLDDSLQRTYEITLSGPIVKDHLTFMYATRLTPAVPISTPTMSLNAGTLDQVYFGNNGTDGTFAAFPYNQNQIESMVQKATFNQYSLFWQVNANHQIEYTYSEGHQTNPDQQYSTGATPDLNLPQVQTTDQCFYNIAYHGIIGSNQSVEIRYGKNRSDTQFPSGPGSPIYVNSGPTAATLGTGAGLIGALNWWQNSFNMYDTNAGNSDNQADKRTTESFLANYNLQLSSHSIDLGYEAQMPIWGTTSKNNSASPQFYTAGRFAPGVVLPGSLTTNGVSTNVGGQYIVYNPKTTTLPGDSLTVADAQNFGNYFLGYEANGIPAMQVNTGINAADIRNPTYSLYANDNWTINDRFSLMYGLRWDDMELKDGLGTKANATTLSPRMEFKWDINGDQSRMVNVSYGDFRGIYNARYYRTNVVTREATNEYHYWTGADVAGAPASGMYSVTQAQILDPGNYSTTADLSYGVGNYNVDPKWKPEVNHEYQVGFRRSYASGGSWRATLVYRSYGDLSYDLADFNTGMITLKNDPDAKREYKGFEFEWNAPLTAHLVFGGSFVYSDLTANTTFGDNTGFSSAVGNFATYGDMRIQLQQAGMTMNQIMPTGQLITSNNDVLKCWLSYHMEAGRAKSAVTLEGSYVSGGHSSLTSNTPDPIDQSLQSKAGNGLPTNITTYFNGRGNYTQPDQYLLNLNYSLDFKIKGSLKFFTQLTVNNLLNHPIVYNTYYGGAGSINPATAGMGYVPSGVSRFGTAYNSNGLSYEVEGYRSLNIDMGIKF